MAAHPLHVFVDIGCIDNDKKLLVAHLVDQQIIHGAAVGIEHHAVENLVEGGARHVVGEDVVHVSLGVAAAHHHLAHVRHVEHAAVPAHGLVLVDDG